MWFHLATTPIAIFLPVHLSVLGATVDPGQALHSANSFIKTAAIVLYCGNSGMKNQEHRI